MDFTFPEKKAPPHPLILKIECQKEALQMLIDHYKEKLDNEKAEVENWKFNELKAIREKYPDEQEDFLRHKEDPIYFEYDFRMEILFNMETAFYHSLFILSYSYFESLVDAINKELSLDSKKWIKCNNKESFRSFLSTSTLAENDVAFVCEKIRCIRNLLTHNYNAQNKPPKQMKVAREENQKDIGLKLLDGTVILEKRYVEYALECEYNVLNALATRALP